MNDSIMQIVYNFGLRPSSSMDRAPDFGSVGCGFESCLGRLFMDEESLNLLRLLLARLERISADSYWAHQASGVRGSLLRSLDRIENGAPVSRSSVKRLIDNGFVILQNAAEEKARQ